MSIPLSNANIPALPLRMDELLSRTLGLKRMEMMDCNQEGEGKS